MKHRFLASTICVLGAIATGSAQTSGNGPGADWTNFGGNASRNGQSSQRGPAAADLLWSGGRHSILAWQPITEGGRVFVVRQIGTPGDPDDAPVVAMDINTGAELWAVDLPFHEGEWTTWIAGARDGRVYVSRSNTEQFPGRLYALDSATGAVLWVSPHEIRAGLYDGVVFAPDGDLIVGESTNLRRVNAEDGATVWVRERQCWNHPACGPVVFGDAIYAIELSTITRFNLTTGDRAYSSTADITFGQTPLMAGNDGTIYVARLGGPPEAHLFHAFQDTGTALVERWKVPVGPVIGSEFGVGLDGSVYMLGPGNTIDRLDPATGGLLNRSASIGTDALLQPRVAIDALGRVFVSNGSYNDGRLFAFNPDLTPRWDVSVPHHNVAGPALGRDGTLVICGVGNDIRAYRTLCPDDDGDEVCEAEDSCPDSILTPTVAIGGCETRVSNHLFEYGCTFADLIDQCFEGATTHGRATSCVAGLTHDWIRQGLIGGAEKGRIQRCAAPRRLKESTD